jgi:CDP-diacylglycerol--serine O-phosphatidyltransferase
MILKRALVPSVFTTLNLLFGFFAILSAIQGKVVTASWMIILAAVWDGLDGKIARKTQTHSEFGIQLDSIADIVSFGVAPSVLIYQVFFYKVGAAGILLSFLPLLFGAIRLARFNSNQDASEEKGNFTGLPIPSMAATLSTYVIFNYDLWEGLRFGPLLVPLVLFLSILMLSNVEYQAMPKFSFRESKKNSILLILMLLGVAIAVMFKERVLFPLTFGFVLFYLFRYFAQGAKDEEEEEVYDVKF